MINVAASRTTRTDRERVKSAFATLRRQGYVTRMNFSCCMGCACAAFNEWFSKRLVPEADRKVVYWHRQDEEHAKWRDGNVYAPLHIRWQGDGNEIVAALRTEGLAVEWSGSSDETIVVNPSRKDSR